MGKNTISEARRDIHGLHLTPKALTWEQCLFSKFYNKEDCTVCSSRRVQISMIKALRYQSRDKGLSPRRFVFHLRLVLKNEFLCKYPNNRKLPIV